MSSNWSRATLIFDLLADYARALEALPRDNPRREALGLMYRALRRETHFLERHPTELFSVLSNLANRDDGTAGNGAASAEDSSVTPTRESAVGQLSHVIERWRRENTIERATLIWLSRPAVPLRSALVAVLRGHEQPIAAVAFAPDGRSLVSASADRSVRVWDFETGQELGAPWQYAAALTSAAFSPDGRLIAVGEKEPTRDGAGVETSAVRLLDAQTGSPIGELRGHTYFVDSLAWSPEGQFLATGSHDGTLRIWNVAARAEVKRMDMAELGVKPAHKAWVTSMAFSPDGRFLAIVTGDTRVHMFDLQADYRQLAVWHGEQFVPVDANDPDIELFLSSDPEMRLVRRVDAESGREDCFLVEPTYLCTSNIAFSPDGLRLAIGAYQGFIEIFDVAAESSVARFQAHDGTIRAVAWSPDGSRIASGSDDMTIALWDARTCERLNLLAGHEQSVSSLDWSPDGAVLASAAHDATIRIWQPELTQDLAAHAVEEKIVQLRFSPDSRRLALALWNGAVRVCDLAGRELALLPVRENPLLQQRVVELSAEAERVERTPHEEALLRAAGRQQVHPADRGASRLSFSPDGTQLAVGAYNSTIQLWDVASGTQRAVLCGHENCFVSVAFSPDGQRLASCANEEQVVVWDVATRSEITRLLWPGRHFEHVAWSPDGSLLCGANGDDGSVRLWDARTWSVIRDLLAEPLSSDQLRLAEPRVVQVSADNTRLLTCGLANTSADPSVREWNVTTGKLLSSHSIYAPYADRYLCDTSRRAFYATGDSQETLIYWRIINQPVAAFPLPLDHLEQAPVGRLWAGVRESHLYVFRLDGPSEFELW